MEASQISNKQIFFLTVFFIQAVIALVNYILAVKHSKEKTSTERKLKVSLDILCGVSWTMTALYKLGEFMLA